MTTQEIISRLKELNSNIALHESRIAWLEANPDMGKAATSRMEFAYLELRHAIACQNAFLLTDWMVLEQSRKPCSNP